MADIEKSKDMVVRYGCEEVKLFSKKSAKLKNAFLIQQLENSLKQKLLAKGSLISDVVLETGPIKQLNMVQRALMDLTNKRKWWN